MLDYQSARDLLVDNSLHTLDTLTTNVINTQQTVYPTILVEPSQIFKNILLNCPDLCWFAVCSNSVNTAQLGNDNQLIGSDDKMVGHLIAHYWLDAENPPRLNSISDILTLPSTNKDELGYQNIFIHDLTIIPDMANQGIARELMSRFLEYLNSWCQPIIISLVSVNGSQKFWAKIGFVPIIQPTEKQIELLKTYGDDTAVIMTRSINSNHPPGNNNLAEY